MFAVIDALVHERSLKRVIGFESLRLCGVHVFCMCAWDSRWMFAVIFACVPAEEALQAVDLSGSWDSLP